MGVWQLFEIIRKIIEPTNLFSLNVNKVSLTWGVVVFGVDSYPHGDSGLTEASHS